MSRCIACGAPLAPQMRYCAQCGLAASASRASSALPSAPRIATSPSTALPDVPAAVQQAEQYLLDLVNQDRIRHGARPLVLDAGLSTVARAHSRALALHEGPPWPGWPHQSRDGSSPFQRMAAGGYGLPPYTTEGENVGGTQGYPSLQAAVTAVHTGMMAEPPGQMNHRGAILNPQFRLIGVGIVALDDRVWITEDFAG